MVEKLLHGAQLKSYKFNIYKTNKKKNNFTNNRDDRWYLNIMSPNTKGGKFAWLDPTSIYINTEAFHDLLDDLLFDLKGYDCDVVAGIDAMGFVLGSALAAKHGKGFLPIRKAGNNFIPSDPLSIAPKHSVAVKPPG